MCIEEQKRKKALDLVRKAQKLIMDLYENENNNLRRKCDEDRLDICSIAIGDIETKLQYLKFS
jgi:hypothetical protein